jgi:hypothetical protein
VNALFYLALDLKVDVSEASGKKLSDRPKALWSKKKKKKKKKVVF